MAANLARIFGTEEDRVNCPFYFKIGACRNGDSCNRLHNRPVTSPTIILPHMYPVPPAAIALAEGQEVSDDVADEAQEHFENFYEDVYNELVNFGEIDDMAVSENICDHMIGNVYVKFKKEEAADQALQKLTGRFYNTRELKVELSPLTDFKEARCRQFEEAQCGRGGYCNFVHWKYAPRRLRRRLRRDMKDMHPELAARDRSRSRDRDRDRDRDRGGRGGGDRDRDRDRGGRGRGGGDRDRHRGGGDRDRDRDRDRRRDSGRDSGRHGDRDRENRDDRNGGGDDRGNGDRQNSEERRAMIAKWNTEGGDDKNDDNNDNNNDDAARGD